MSRSDLLKLVGKLEGERAPWMPSEDWEALERQGRVISKEKAEEIRKRLAEAPEAVIGHLIGKIGVILGGIV
jgi:hypothetical protein